MTTKSERKDAFLIKKEYRSQISRWAVEQKAELLDAIFKFQRWEEYQTTCDRTADMMAMMIDYWQEKNDRYDKICEERSKAWKNHEWNQYTTWDDKRKVNPKAQKNTVEQNGTNGTNGTDKIRLDNNIIISKDIIVDESTTQKIDNKILYDSYPFKSKWIDKEKCDKLITKQLKQWATLEWMLKEMKLEWLELRIKQWLSYQYWKKMETWLKEYVEWMADNEDRLKKLLLEHRKRLENWPAYKKNPRDELCELFWEDYVKKLFMETKQWVKLFTT